MGSRPDNMGQVAVRAVFDFVFYMYACVYVCMYVCMYFFFLFFFFQPSFLFTWRELQTLGSSPPAEINNQK